MIFSKNNIIGFLIVLSLPALATAKVSGLCVNCHTMHNSQGGIPMAKNLDGSNDASANNALLNTSCIGCHQGTNSASGTVPFVLNTSGAPNYGSTGTTGDTLAGGNFYWVSTGLNRTGHNVDVLSGQDPEHGNLPPGGSALSSQLTCAGTTGCHGSSSTTNPTLALFGSHHNNDMSSWKDGTSIAQSYRFLEGVQGFEDPDWEYQPTSTAHNKYYGVDRTNENDNTGTISSHCGRCHADFHNGSGQISAGIVSNNVWLRHPTDYDMSNSRSQGLNFSSSEYAAYNDYQGTGNPYSAISPVAVGNTSTTINTNVYTQTDDAIVMCLSCHRAHGSPFDGILRWDYKNWPGTGFNGCAICHTAKD